MAQTFTIQIPLGFKAPPFNLPDVIIGNTKSYKDIRGEKGTLVVFICNHCPYVIHVIDELVRIGNEYQRKGIGMVMISSNDIENYPEDSPELMVKFAKENKFPFAYLYDETQDVAKAYQAACTPDFNLFDKDDLCVYRGQLDDARPNNGKTVNGKDLRKAMDEILSGNKPDTNQIPSSGCNIKWKTSEGNALKPL